VKRLESAHRKIPRHGDACEVFLDPFVRMVVEETIHIISAREATRELELRRLRKNRAMSSVTHRMPEDVVEDLKRIAPTLGFAGYQPLIRARISKGRGAQRRAIRLGSLLINYL
jgi:hypothetical protein